LYNTFFKIPMFIVQYNAGTKRIPTLKELSEQFNFTVPGEADVILRVMEADPRVPKFIERDAKTGEITKVDIEKIKASPQLSRVLELPYDDKVRADYAKKYGFNFTLAHLTPQMQQTYGGVSVFPTMFFVDKHGTIVKHFVNFQDKATLEAAIQLSMK